MQSLRQNRGQEAGKECNMKQLLVVLFLMPLPFLIGVILGVKTNTPTDS